ncbi:hypothetical protein BGZ94_004949 [Podila epigama]|nr:hypothetical protein BGZ94_004949 [Podila epigama]
MGGIFVGAVTVGLILYRCEKKKSTKKTSTCDKSNNGGGSTDSLDKGGCNSGRPSSIGHKIEMDDVVVTRKSKWDASSSSLVRYGQEECDADGKLEDLTFGAPLRSKPSPIPLAHLTLSQGFHPTNDR